MGRFLATRPRNDVVWTSTGPPREAHPNPFHGRGSVESWHQREVSKTAIGRTLNSHCMDPPSAGAYVKVHTEVCSVRCVASSAPHSNLAIQQACKRGPGQLGPGSLLDEPTRSASCCICVHSRTTIDPERSPAELHFDNPCALQGAVLDSRSQVHKFADILLVACETG